VTVLLLRGAKLFKGTDGKFIFMHWCDRRVCFPHATSKVSWTEEEPGKLINGCNSERELCRLGVSRTR